MNIYTIIITEFLLLSSSILLLFRLRARLGLAPLYILLGAVQYLQANLGSSLSFIFFDDYVIYPGSIILFSGVLFAVLLIYIKEGVASARTLIIGIVLSNIIMSLMFEITYLQQIIDSQINNTTLNPDSVFNINLKYFIIGTAILFMDFLLLVVLYQYLILKLKKLPFFLIIFISLWSVLIFDAVAFNLAIFYGTPLFKTSLLGHLLGKFIAAIIYSIILYLYVKYLDSENTKTTFIANQERDVFSIINYKEKYEDLKVQIKQEEKKLTSQIETTLNNISDGFVALDTNWCYTYVNQKAGEFLGRNPSSLIGKHIWTEFPDGVGLPFYNLYYKAVETQQTQYLKEYYPPFDKWFENRIYPSPEGLTIYFTDITERVKIEELLIESEKYLDNIISNIGDPLFVKDEQSRLLVVNDAFCKMFHLSRADIIGKTLAEDVTPEEQEIFLRIDKQVLSTGIENVNEESLTVRGNETRLISTKKTRFVDEKGTKFLIGVIRDVTEKRKAEKEILEIQHKLEAAIRIGNIGYWSWDIINDNVYWSDLMYEIYDVDPNTPLKYDTVLSCVHPDDREFHNRLVEQRIKNKDNSPFEYRVLCKDNTIKYVMVQMEVVENDQGEAIAFQGTVIDISERKKAEAKLIESEEYLDNIINNIGDPVFVKDYKSRFLIANDAFYKLFNRGKDEILGKIFANSVPPEERERYLKVDNLVLSEGIEDVNEDSVNVEGGETRFISTKKTRFIDEKGNKYLIGVIRDITERKKQEETLKESEAKFRAMVDASPIGIFFVNPDGNVTYGNAADIHMIGLTQEEALGLNWVNAIHPEDRERVTKKWVDAMEAGIPYKDQGRYLHKDGKIVFWDVITAPVIIDNEITGYIGMVVDITEKVKSEEEITKYKNHLEELVELRTNQLEKEKIKAQSADLMKSAFLATMSHELRTPMNSIIGFTGILLKEIAGPLNEEQKKQLEMVKNSGEHLLGLINDVLDISKIEAGKLKVSFYPFNYLSCLEKTIEFLLPQASKKGLDIKTEISSMDITLVSDERRIEQILLNLLSNAIKFSKTGTVLVKVAVKDKTLVTQVIDQGIGISKNDIIKLFMPFIQLEGGLSRNHEGTGLGLAISKNLIEKLGGSIHVESELGKGSNFTFKLPLEHSNNK
ncbi:PAS domain S-box protein [Hwangdonia sp.]|uniref:PAS domain S-box protein n=1 Tax=Hwangdonia sp. TaxID=1883432 RepID=UPI003AB20009